MGITSRIVDRIMPLVSSGWSRTGDLSVLHLIQEAQDELLLQCNSELSAWIGSENKGFPPYLTTVAGTYKYTIEAANLTGVSTITATINGTAYTVRPKLVQRVFIDTIQNFDFMRKFVGEAYMHGYNNPFRTSEERVEFANIPVDSTPALEGNYPTITFKEDPGDSDDLFFVAFTVEAPRLTSEAVPVVVPVEFYPALIDYVLGRITEMDNGKSSDRLNRFYSGYDNGSDWVPSWIERYRLHLQGGAQTELAQRVPLF
jgi:hypothetical protein